MIYYIYICKVKKESLAWSNVKPMIFFIFSRLFQVNLPSVLNVTFIHPTSQERGFSSSLEQSLAWVGTRSKHLFSHSGANVITSWTKYCLKQKMERVTYFSRGLSLLRRQKNNVTYNHFPKGFLVTDCLVFYTSRLTQVVVVFWHR